MGQHGTRLYHLPRELVMMVVTHEDDKYEYGIIEKTEFRKNPEGLILYGETDKHHFRVARQKIEDEHGTNF